MWQAIFISAPYSLRTVQSEALLRTHVSWDEKLATVLIKSGKSTRWNFSP
jgi:hypothetical protein